jgi:hypothetical protein
MIYWPSWKKIRGIGCGCCVKRTLGRQGWLFEIIGTSGKRLVLDLCCLCACDIIVRHCAQLFSLVVSREPRMTNM